MSITEAAERLVENDPGWNGTQNFMTIDGFDLSPCMECGKAVVCVPDGLACCGDGAAQLADAANSEAEENRR